MIEAALLNEGWDAGTDWDVLAARAVDRAIRLSPYASLADIDTASCERATVAMYASIARLTSCASDWESVKNSRV